jgi:hypothetical protein
MNQKSALPSQNQRMNNPQHRVDSVRIPRLPNVTATRPRIPPRVEVATLQQPLSVLQPYLHIIVSVLCRLELLRRFEQINVELELRMESGFYKPRVAIFEQLAKPDVLRMQRNRHPPDPNGDRVGQRHFRRMAHW